MVEWLAGNRIRGTTAERTGALAGQATPTKIIDGNYTVLTYTADGKFIPKNSFDVEYLVVGGGGSGAVNNGGGGAGGYRTATGFGVTAQSYSITVGAGGIGSGYTGYRGNSGSDSVFSTITSTGGGGGGGENSGQAIGGNGGSGGGGGYGVGIAGGISSPVTSPVQGYAGGTSGNNQIGGGGGGSSVVGSNAVGNTAGSGGNGTANSISGSSVIYAAGGGGGDLTSGASGGSGGIGGNGAGNNGTGTAGDTNTGSGGGGSAGGSGNSGNGGSGIVILRFLTSGNTYDVEEIGLMQSLPSGSVGGWHEIGRTTLGTALDDIVVSSLADKRYLMVLTYTGSGSGNIHTQLRLNSDTGSNYSYRFSDDGAADVTGTSKTLMASGVGGSASSVPMFGVGYLSNLATKEKLWIQHGVGQRTAGAGTAPNRRESVGKHAQTTNPISAVTQHNGEGGDFTAGAECVVLGWDPADTHTTNFWEELANVDYQSGGALVVSTPTFTAKKYLWVQAYVKQASPYASGMTFNGDTTRGSTNYAFRYSANGGTDPTPHINTWATIKNYSTLAGGGFFFNAFIINNASNEKLVIGTTSENPATGSGAAPNNIQSVAKWNDATNPITKVNIIGESGSGNISNGTQIRVWGSD